MSHTRRDARTIRWTHTAILAAALTLCSLATRGDAQAAPTISPGAIQQLFLKDLDHSGTRFVALANAFPADKYSWRPGPGVRSVGEVFMHVVSEYYGYSPMAYGATPSPSVDMSDAGLTKFEQNATKERVLDQLQSSMAYAKTTIGKVDPNATSTVSWFGHPATIAETSTSMTDDLHEHLGQLIAYARMNKIVPPWSK